MQAQYFAMVGDGDRRETLTLTLTLTLADGRVVRQLSERHPRSYQSIFGKFTLERVVYGTREASGSRRYRWMPGWGCRLVVMSADGKGVPLRKLADAPLITAARLSSPKSHDHARGPKPDRKKMTLLGAAYQIDPYLRTQQAVVDALVHPLC